MQITISGKHMETGTALKEHVDEALGSNITKYFENAIGANVIFSKNDNMFSCHITLDEGVRDKTVIASEDESDNVYTAFNGALAKIEKQVRRYKRKIKDRSHNVSVKELSQKVANA